MIDIGRVHIRMIGSFFIYLAFPRHSTFQKCNLPINQKQRKGKYMFDITQAVRLKTVRKDKKVYGYIDFEKTCSEFADKLMDYNHDNDIMIQFNVFKPSEMAKDAGEEV